VAAEAQRDAIKGVEHGRVPRSGAQRTGEILIACRRATPYWRESRFSAHINGEKRTSPRCEPFRLKRERNRLQSVRPSPHLNWESRMSRIMLLVLSLMLFGSSAYAEQKVLGPRTSHRVGRNVQSKRTDCGAQVLAVRHVSGRRQSKNRKDCFGSRERPRTFRSEAYPRSVFRSSAGDRHAFDRERDDEALLACGLEE
jgi:hypothetical protein